MARLGPKERLLFEAVRHDCYRGLEAMELLRCISDRLTEHLHLDAYCSMQIDPGSVLPVDSSNHGWDYQVAHPLLVEHALLASPTADPPGLFRRGIRSIDVDALLPTGATTKSDPYFQWHLLPFARRYEAQVMCVAGGRARAFLTFARTEATGSFEPKDHRLLEAISPHVATAVHSSSMQRTILAAADAPVGFLVFDPEGRLELSNKAGERWMAHASPERWEMALGALCAALARARDIDAPAPVVYVLDRENGALHRLSAERKNGADGRPRTMILVEPARAQDDNEALQRLGLTAKEAAVAVALLRGDRVEEIASDLACSPYTVNDHMKCIYDKLGVSSRRTLAARLSGAN